MTRPFGFISLLVLLIAAAGCDFGKTSTGATAPTSSPDQSSVAFSQTDLTVGTGATVANGTTATVQYGAWLYSETGTDHKGTQVDQGQFSFVVGTNQVIKGLDQGIVGMKAGGTRRLIVPPSLAYGSAGNPPIPPNAAMVFDIAVTNATTPAT